MEHLDLVRRDDVRGQAEGEEAPGALQTTTDKLAPWLLKLCCTNYVHETTVHMYC
jgi:hypothetical protein